MNNQVATLPTTNDATAIERALLQGDLGGLTENQRLSYYHKVCESLGLNPLTKPFEYIRLNQKLVLYAKRDCTDQLRKIHNVSVRVVSRERLDDLIVVTSQASLPSGRIDESVGAITIANLKGENLANAMMKAETKAKRRVTLSICGLAMLDESEVGSVAGAVPIAHSQPVSQPTPHSQPNSQPMYPGVATPPKYAKPPLEFAKTPAPWEQTAQAPAPQDRVIEAQVEDVTLEALGEFEVKEGTMKGVKFKDKPDAFWEMYNKDLKLKISSPTFPDAFRASATELTEALSLYLAR